MSPVHSSPQGGSVVSGSASISQSGASTTINQLSKQVIIDWNSFGIGPNELVQFLQPSSVAIALNRVTGVSPSLIYGILQANGRIFLINPNGILFGAGSEVDVGGLVASTLDISNSNFLSGNYTFDEAQGTDGFVVNEGTITTTAGGTVALYGATVENEGVIDAPSGFVDLEAQPSVVLSLDDSGLVNVEVQKGSPVYRETLPTETGSPDHAVPGSQKSSSSESWTRENDPGKFTIGDGENQDTRGGWENATLSAAVNQTGLSAATSALSQGDQIVLSGDPGLVVNAGTIDVNGSANNNAGSVVLNSTLGTALLPGSLIEANGEGENSSGGSVKILSDLNTGFAAGSEIEAEGGTSGNGGTVEESGDAGVSVDGVVNTSAQNGKMGTFLLDPSYIEIVSGSAGTGELDGSLPSITYSVLDQTEDTVSVGSLEAQTSNITLQANSTIDVEASVTLSSGVSLTMQTLTGNIAFTTSTYAITASGAGSITIEAGTQAGSLGSVSLGELATSNEPITVTGAGGITVGTISAGTATVTLETTLGNIVGNGTASTNVTAGELIVESAIGIGTSAAPLTTAVSKLQAYNTTSNGIYLSNTGSLAIDDYSIGRGTGVENDALGGAISISATGSIDLPGNFTANTTGYSTGILALGGGNITLTTTGGTSNITACDGANCTGMAAAESDGGNITFTAGGAINLGVNGNADVATAFGTTNPGAITLTASTGLVTLNNGTNVESNSGNISVTGTGISVQNGSQVLSSGAGNVSLTATSGNLTVDATSDVASLSTGNLTFTASGNIAINDTAYTQGNITADSTSGTITTTVAAGQPVLVAGGSLSVSTAGTIGVSTGDPLTIQSSSLTLTDSGSGSGIYVYGTGGLTSLAVTTDNGTVSVNVLDGSLVFTGGVLTGTTSGSLTSFLFDNTGGNVTLNSTINAGTGSATLEASGYIANGGSANVTAGTLTMTAGTGIGYNGTTASAIPTSATNLTVSTTTATTAQINVSDSSSLASLSITTNNSPVGITASNVTGSVCFDGSSCSGDLLNAQFTGSTLTTLSVNNTGGNIVLSSTDLVNMGSNAATNGTLTSSGYIENSLLAGSVTANTLTMTAASGIGYNGTSASSISTSAANLTVKTTTLNTAQINVADTTSLATLSVTTDNSSVAITGSNITGFSLAGGSGGSDDLNAQFTGSTLTTLLIDNVGGNLVFLTADKVNMGSNAATNGTLEASGYIANGATSGSVAANTLTMTAGTGIGWNGTTASSISTSAANLTVSTSTLNTAEINVADTTSLATLSVTTDNSSVAITGSNITGFSLAGGSGGSDDLDAVFTGTTLTSLLIDNTAGNLVLLSGDVVTAGTNAASATTLKASGDIANGASAGAITSDTLTLTAGTYIGTAGSNLSTKVSTLNATASGGGIYVSNTTSGALTLGTVTASGSNNNVTIANSAGNITVGTVSGAAVTITSTFSTGTITDSGSSGGATGTTSVTLSAPAGIGTSGNYFNIYSPSVTATTTTANTASIYLTDTDYLTTLSLNTANSTVAVTSIGSDSVSFTGGSGGSDLLNAQFAGVPVSSFTFENSDGNIAFGASDTVYGGLGSTVDLIASGNITTSSATATDVTAQQLQFNTGSGFGTAADPIITEVSQIGGYNNSSGGIYVTNTGAVTVDDYDYVDLGPFTPNVGEPWTGSGDTTGQGFGIENAASGGAIVFTDNGSIDGPNTLDTSGIHCIGGDCIYNGTDPIGVTFFAPEGGNITIDAVGSTSDVIGGDTTWGAMAEADGGSVLVEAGQDIDEGVETATDQNSADIYTFKGAGYSGNGSGTITLNAGRNIIFAGSSTIQSYSGTITMDAAGVLSSTTNSNVASNSTQTVCCSQGTGPGNIVLTGGSVAFVDVGTDGNITVTATTGSITDPSNGGATCSAAAATCDYDIESSTGLLTMTAATYIGTSTYPIDTWVNNLNVTTTTANTGSIYIANKEVLDSLSVTTANSTVSITSTKGTLTFAGGSSGSDDLTATYTNTSDELASFAFDNSDGNIEFTSTADVDLAGTGSVTLTASGAISDNSSNSTSAPAVTTGGTLDLVAASVGVVGTGTWKNPPPAGWTALYTDVKTLNATITNSLVLDNSVSLTEGTITVGGTAYIIANGSVISGGIIAGDGIDLIATGSIVDGSGGADWDNQAGWVILQAGGGIGTASDPVTAQVNGGTFTVSAAGGPVYVSGNVSPTILSAADTVYYNGACLVCPIAPSSSGSSGSNTAGETENASDLFAQLLQSDSAGYFDALSQDNPYLSNTPDWSSAITLTPLNGMMLPTDPILFEDWLQIKRKKKHTATVKKS